MFSSTTSLSRKRIALFSKAQDVHLLALHETPVHPALQIGLSLGAAEVVYAARCFDAGDVGEHGGFAFGEVVEGE